PHVYAVTEAGVATCYRADTGGVVWQERLGGNHSASPVSAEGRIYFLSEQGETTVIAAGPKFEILARNDPGEISKASIGIAQGRLCLRTQKLLYWRGEEAGDWRLETVGIAARRCVWLPAEICFSPFSFPFSLRSSSPS